MQPVESKKREDQHVCFRCGGAIEVGQKMVTLSVTVETPTGDDVVEVLEANAISTLCPACASILLGQAIASDLGLMLPLPREGKEDPDTETHNHNSSGENTTGQGDYDEMVLAEFYLAVGRSALEEGDWDRAVTAFTSYIELRPDDPLAYDRRGIACGRAERYDEAMADFSRAIELEPAFAGAYNNRGLSYYRQGRFDEAIADYDTAIELSPGVAVFYNNRGLAHRWKNDLYVAISDYDRAIELDPTLPEVHNNRGEAYVELGEDEKAAADFEHELSLNPGDILAYANRVATVGGVHGRPEGQANGHQEGGKKNERDHSG